MMQSDEYLRLLMNAEIYCNMVELDPYLHHLELLYNWAAQHTVLHGKTYKVITPPTPMKYAIIDFEGYFPKVIGIRIYNRVFQFYINTAQYESNFHDLLLSILEVLKDLFLFSFSPWEEIFIQRYLYFFLKERHSLERLSFFRQLRFIDLQKSNFQALEAALYSLGQSIPDDPVLRQNKNVDILFDQGELDIILRHNTACLEGTLTILYLQYFKENLIEFDY